MVSNYENNKLYIWNAAGEPSSTKVEQPYLFPTQMTVIDTDLVVSYDSASSTVDQLYGLTSAELYDLNNGETQCTLLLFTLIKPIFSQVSVPDNAKTIQMAEPEKDALNEAGPEKLQKGQE